MKIFKITWKWSEVLSTLVELVLAIVGGLLVFPLVSILGFLYSLSKHLIINRDYSVSRQFNPILRSFTLASDGLACAAGGELLNDVLKVKGIITYGKWYNTISSITGLRLLYENQDNRFRKFLDKILGKKHCEESIREEEHFFYKHKTTTK